MLYLSGVVRPDLPAMITPRMGQRPPDGQPWAADNGRFASPQDYTDDSYLEWLFMQSRDVDRCLFATAPDVVGDATATLALSAPMFEAIRRYGYPVALVAQDGLEDEPIPWDDFDALFIGGTTAWKLSAAAADIAAQAKARSKWVHMGRVNSLRRMRYGESIGCDSADGTVLKHDPNRPVASWSTTVIREPSIWGIR